MPNFYLLILTVVNLLLCAPSHAKTQPDRTEGFYLKSLQSDVRKNLIKYDGHITIAMIYQPDCSWCKKQGKSFKKIIDQCQEQVNLSLIGNKGSRSQLKRELKYFNKNLPAYQADKLFLRSIDGIDASPTTLFFNAQGQLLIKKRGYIEPQQLYLAVSQLTGNSCNIF